MRRIATAVSTAAIAVAIALGCSGNGRADAGAVKQIWREGTGQPVAQVAVPVNASLSALLKAVKPAVVNISSTTVVKNPHAFLRNAPHPGDDDEPDFFQFFGPNQPKEFKGQSLGSGFIINPDGYVLTNNHVVENATDIKVVLPDAREFEAKVVGRDKATDVALLKLPKASGLPTVALGNSDALEQGDFVLALGSPFGFRESATFGIVSAKDRSLSGNPFDDFIQTDAAINQGNSGGPLFNLKGEVVGINTAIISPQIGQGLGFAVPINLAKSVIPQLLTKGRVARGYLGVSVSDLTPDLLKGFGIPAGTKGALVQNVMADSPAARVGIQAGDIVTGVNGRPVEGAGELTRTVSSVSPGTKVSLELLRSGKKRQIAVAVGTRPDEEKLAAGGEEEEPGRPARKDEKLGIRVAPLTPELARELHIPTDRGVVVVGVTDDGPADRAGVRRGDVILEVQAGQRSVQVNRVEDLVGAVSSLRAGDIAVIRVRRGDQAVYVPIKVGGEKK